MCHPLSRRRVDEASRLTPESLLWPQEIDDLGVNQAGNRMSQPWIDIGSSVVVVLLAGATLFGTDVGHRLVTSARARASLDPRLAGLAFGAGPLLGSVIAWWIGSSLPPRWVQLVDALVLAVGAGFVGFGTFRTPPFGRTSRDAGE